MFDDDPGLVPTGECTEEKNSSPKTREHTMEHSIGVTDTFRKACRFAHDLWGCEYAPASSSGCGLSAPAGNRSFSNDCK